MNNNYFIQKLGFEFDTQVVPKDVRKLVEEIGIDAVHCSGEYPAVFFKSIPDFNINSLKLIADIQKKIWNNSSVVFLYVTSPVEIRIYNCNEKPIFFNIENPEIQKEFKNKEIESCQKSNTKKLLEITQIFSSIAVDSGTIWTSKYSKKIKLQTKVDRYLVNSLLKLAKKLSTNLKESKLDIKKEHEIIHNLLMRSIFTMYLQDRKAIPQEIWNEIGKNDFLEILDNKTTTYKLFKEIEKHFNGNVFPVTNLEFENVNEKHLGFLKNCLIDGDIYLEQQKLFENWRLFDFSFIRIELLSEIYENFLNEFDPERKKQTGTYYTPPSLVELVLDNVLPKNSDKYNLKILDFACGSGIFLAQAYKRIVNYWIVKHPKRKLNFSILSEIMQNSIFGIELDPKSIKVAAFSLYLALLDFLNPRDVWLKNGEKFPYLIRNLNSDKQIDRAGCNLFCADTIEENGEFEDIAFDIVVGNPPFGTKKLPENIKNYCDRNSFDKQFVIPFIHKSVNLCPEGKITLLFNTKLLTNTKQTAQNFRKWLFNDNYVEKVYNLSILRKAPKDFGGHLFSSAVVPVSIVCFQKSTPKESKQTIEYWAPKTFIKNHVADGVLVDSSDIKHLPREICQQPDTKIWKIAQWGTMADYFLIEKNKKDNLHKYFDQNDYKYGVGLELSNPLDKPNSDIKNIPHLKVNNLYPFYTSKLRTTKIKNEKFRRCGDIEAYKAPHVIFKEGISTILENTIKQKRIVASYLDYDCSFYKGLAGVHFQDDSKIRLLTAYFNSTFCRYYMFLIASSWAIERDVIKYNELFNLPNILDKDEEISERIVNLLANQITIITKNEVIDIDTATIDKIDFEFSKLLNLSVKDNIQIHDTNKYSIDLFYNGEKSIALKPIASKKPETISYSQILCEEINDFLKIGDYKINAKVYEVSPYTPLCMVVLQFVEPEKVIHPQSVNSENDFENNLSNINKYTLQEYSQNIYVRKQIRYYDKDSIFIIKPNQKRFWTRSQGIDDASTIINELIAMDDGE